MPDADIRAVISVGDQITAELGNTAEYAARAGKLMKTCRIELTGQAQGEALFDGSADISIYTAIERLTNEELEDLLHE